ncbi:MAG: hypothetical protein M1820_010072 [Bogoriella megaspora]|nr:MAG: hypothetical protein M1820_010072 [Bogoriella megaspora]
MALDAYTAEPPYGVAFDPEISDFFKNFYAVSDSAGAHEVYADQFTSNATLIMGSNKVQGRNEIIELRRSMWEKVSTRQHKPLRIFTSGAGAENYMLYGTVDYIMKDGEKASVDWAAHSHFVKVEGRYKMDFYQVYISSAPQRQVN